MDGQKFIIDAIEPLMLPGEQLEWLKYISETSLLKVEDYPALIVEMAGDKIESVSDDGNPNQESDRVTMALVISLANLNALTRASFKTKAAEIDARFTELQAVLLNAWNTSPKVSEKQISGFEIGEGTIDIILIDGDPKIVKQADIILQMSN
jgi:hypothetical protein